MNSVSSTCRSPLSRVFPAKLLPGCRGVLAMVMATFALLWLTGCRSPQPTFITPEDAAPDRSIALREGDVIKVSFPGSPNLNTTQQIRRDGNVNLALVGDVKAAGLVPAALEKEILRVYGNQLLSREVSVTLESSAFSVFVTGMVVRPGKVTSDRPLTLLEAIMEAGGFDNGRANLKSVRVLRREGDRMRTFTINLQPAMSGGPAVPFHLRPSDIVSVPEKFSLF